MATNLAIDDRLLGEALRVGGHGTKRETVNEALHEYVQRRKRRSFVKLFGTIDFRPEWDHKKARRRASTGERRAPGGPAPRASAAVLCALCVSVAPSRA